MARTFPMTKKEQAELDDLLTTADASLSDLNAAIIAYNETMEAAKAVLENKVLAHNDALYALNTFRENFAFERTGILEDRSEAFQDGEKGQAILAWISEWENLEVPQIDMEWPEEMEQIDGDEIDNMQNALAREPEG